MSSRFITAVGCLASFVVACSGHEDNEVDVGQVDLQLATAPSDVRCLVLQATNGDRTVSRNIDVMPGQILTAPVAGLPTGTVTISTSAYATACSAVTASSVANWVSDPVTQIVTLTKGSRVPLNIVLRPNGVVQPTIDWQDDNVAGAGGAGGATSGGTTSGGTTTGGTTGDTTPPTVVSVVPANGTRGVTASSNVVITFSEAMDQASVASALSLSNFATSSLTLAWSSDARTLTITPSGGLQYATGTSQATTTATNYVVSLSTSARDLAGNPLGTSLSSSFSTLRQINQTLQAESTAHYDTYGPAVGNGISVCASATESYNIGWWLSMVSGGTYYGYAIVNLSAIGTPSSITQIQSARFVASQGSPNGNFYGSGGTVLLDELTYQPFSNSVLNASVVRSLGTLSNSAVLNPTLDISSGFVASFGTGNSRALYRIGPNGNTSTGGTYAIFFCGGFAVNVQYLTP